MPQSLKTHSIKNASLDYVAKNYNINWFWALTPRLTGTVSADRSQSLNDFNDTNSTIQNIRTNQNQAFLIDYNPGGGWHLLGGFSRQESQNSQTFFQDASTSSNSADVGVKYDFPSGSSIRLMNHIRKGKFDDRQIDTTAIAFLQDTGYKETETEINLQWLLSAKSNLSITTAYLSRKNDNFSIRDYSGLEGTVAFNWLPTAKIGIRLTASSTLGNFQTDVDSYTRTNGISLRPTYSVTSKITLTANVGVSEREFLGDGYAVPTFASRKDDVQSAGIGVQWAPTLNSTVGINLQYREVDSNNDFFDYTSNTATLFGNILF